MNGPTLCVRRGALGDTLLMIPLLRALRAAAPGQALHFAGDLDHAVLLEEFGVVDRALSSESLQLWSSDPSAHLAEYARIVTDQPLRSLPAGIVVQQIDPVPDESCGVPAAEQLLRRLDPSAATTTSPRLVAQRPSPAEQAEILLHPGAGSTRKCWPAERWSELARALLAENEHVTFVLGPVELERRTEVEIPAGCALVEAPPILGLAARIGRACAFVGNDSGVSHLAAALAVPTVALFGPTEPRIWAPRGRHVCVVGEHTTGPPDASVGAVRDALRSLR